MINLPEDVAKKLYAIYAATLTNPVPFDEMVLTDQVQWAYEKGKVKPEQQLSLIHNFHNQNADLHEPYDMGVLNALRIAMLIFTDNPVSFVGKPKIEDLQPKLDKANKRAVALAKKVGNLQSNLEASKTIAVKIKEKHAGEVKTIKETAESYKKKLVLTKVDLKNAKSALKTASVTV